MSILEVLPQGLGLKFSLVLKIRLFLGFDDSFFDVTLKSLLVGVSLGLKLSLHLGLLFISLESFSKCLSFCTLELNSQAFSKSFGLNSSSPLFVSIKLSILQVLVQLFSLSFVFFDDRSLIVDSLLSLIFCLSKVGDLKLVIFVESS